MSLYSLFDHGTSPALTFPDVGSDPNQNIGTVFLSSAAGTVTSVWIYIGNTNIGGHSGSAMLYPFSPVNGSVPAALATKAFTFQASIG